MTTLHQNELVQLVNESGNRFVSLYMPTYAAGREQAQNAIRFEKLREAACDQLEQHGMSARDIRDFVAEATQLIQHSEFWHSLTTGGIAVLVSTGQMRIWRLPFACEELCVVGKRFHLTPLVAWLNDDAQYYLLSVSQHRVRLSRATRYTLEEIKLPDLPDHGIELLHYDVREGLYQAHTGQPQLRGKEGVVFTGQGGEVDVAKDELAAYFRLIDAAVNKFLHEHTEPLVFVGVDYLFPIYRQHNHYAHLLPLHVSGNPDLLTPSDLRERAWPIVEDLLSIKRHAAVAQYWNFVRQDRCSNLVDDIVSAAYAGAIDTLFISPNIRFHGAFDPSSMTVRRDEVPRHHSEDLVNLAACLVLKNRGTIMTAASGDIPGGGPMAAVFRYAYPPSQTESLGATSVSGR